MSYVNGTFAVPTQEEQKGALAKPRRQKATPHRSNSTINPDTVHGVQGVLDNEK